MSQRYFSEAPLSGERMTLRGPEAHHLAAVMRASAGDEITLFDGAGVECTASVVRVGKRDVELALGECRPISREPTVQLQLAIALPKGDRQKWLVEKAVELGVATLTPLVCEHSVVKLKDSSLDRLERSVIEASKQCGRNHLMQIAPPQPFAQFVRDASPQSQRLIAHPETAGHRALQVQELPPVDIVIAAVGPEGGFSNEEVQQAVEAGWQAVSLGRRILRVETAALKLAASILGD